MTSRSIGPVGSRSAAIVLFLIALGVSFSVTAVPVLVLNSGYQRDLDDLHRQLVRYESIAAKDSELRGHLASLQRAQASSGHLLRSDSLMVAAAEMQADLEKIADAHETQLVSTRILDADGDAEDEVGLMRVALDVQARGTLENLVNSVYALEASPTLFFIEDFSSRIASMRRMRGQEPQSIFEARFTLVGYMAEMQ